MTLRSDEYKIMDDGIWMPKKVLEEWRKHYFKVADQCKNGFKNRKDYFRYPFYIGKSDVLVELLKHFDELEEDKV